MNEPTTIGLSEKAHSKLQQLKEDGHFSDMADGYRFAIALALAHGQICKDAITGRTTIFNVGTLDPDNNIKMVISALREPTDEPVYKTAEKLAEWGVEELHRLSKDRKIPFAKLLDEAESFLMEAESSIA